MAAETSALPRRIGVVDLSSGNWAASGHYTRMTLRSLSAACRRAGVEIYLFSGTPEATPPIDGSIVVPVVTQGAPGYAWPTLFPGEARARRWLGRGEKTRPFRGEMRLRRLLGLTDEIAAWTDPLFAAARAHDVPVLLPLMDMPARSAQDAVRTIGWIPDFQHVYLPEFFPEDERLGRDAMYRRVAEGATRIMLSSRSAHDHFTTFAPAQAHKAEIVPFPSLLAFEGLSGDGSGITDTLRRFHLPSRFLLVCNQFWMHKNHAAVVEAIARLRRGGVRIPAVFTGLPADYRDPSNRSLSRLLQQIASGGVWDQITVLGQVDYSDLLNLMRAAAVIVQPSRFEGWSTVVQDAKALGRPLLCSDLPVHHEQAPDALGFFGCDRPDVLADLLAAHWPDLEPGPDLAAENKALTRERAFAEWHGQTLLRICEKACGGES